MVGGGGKEEGQIILKIHLEDSFSSLQNTGGLWRREELAIGFDLMVGLDGREAYPNALYFLSF